MEKHGKNASRRSRRHGAVILYVVVAMFTMMGICSLAVDFGRVVTAKTELRRAADAAARAACYDMSTGDSLGGIRTTAETIANKNTVDGTPVVLVDTDILVGLWNGKTKSFTADSNAMSKANANASSPTYAAVQVSASRTKAKGNPISLIFAQVLGAKTCDVHAVTVVDLFPITSVSYNGSGNGSKDMLHTTSNPWLSGVATADDTTAYWGQGGKRGSVTGTGSSQDDGYATTKGNHFYKYDEANPSQYGQSMNTKLFSTDTASDQPYSSPMQVGSQNGGSVNGVNTISIVPGAILTITNVKQAGSTNVNNDFTSKSNYDATGNNGGSLSYYSNTDSPTDAGNGPNGSAENGISNIYAPLNSIVGVFSDGKDPTGSKEGNVTQSNPDGTAPKALDYSTQKARDYTNISPSLRQSFYVGDGQTSSETQQTIVVPPNATSFFLGTMDGHEWTNNSGGFDLTINEFTLMTVK
jgi:Flp pilus assembly protein TadG